MQSRGLRSAYSHAVLLTCMTLSVGSFSGCGSSTPTGMPEKASSADLEAAKQSLAAKSKVRGKGLAEDANLSAKERRILAKEGLLPKK